MPRGKKMTHANPLDSIVDAMPVNPIVKMAVRMVLPDPMAVVEIVIAGARSLAASTDTDIDDKMIDCFEEYFRDQAIKAAEAERAHKANLEGLDGGMPADPA